jgi:Fic family protein
MTRHDEVVKLWQGWNVQTESDIDKHLHNFRILFAYHSGKIENDDISYHDTREIFENSKVINYTGDPRALFEQQNQKLCYEFLKPKLANKEPLTIDLVKDIHRIITAGCYDNRRYVDNNERPGEFKKHDYVVGQQDVGSPPEEVETDLQELLDDINSIDSLTPDKTLKASAFLHVNFENIHPFADGNGRVGRTMMNYYLMTNFGDLRGRQKRLL